MGTIGAVFFAIFQKRISDRINRPVLSIDCKKNKLFYEEKMGQSSTSERDKEIVVRVRVYNKGRGVALHSAMYIDSYYKHRTSDNKYTLKEFTPCQLFDSSGNTPKAIVPELPFYYDVAVIRKTDDMMQEGGDGKSKQNYKLSILCGGKAFEIGKGSFVIPVKFYCSRSKPCISYVNIVWDSDQYKLEDEFFSMRVLSNDEVKTLKSNIIK